jgi:hypothetical protein
MIFSNSFSPTNIQLKWVAFVILKPFLYLAEPKINETYETPIPQSELPPPKIFERYLHLSNSILPNGACFMRF